MERKGGFTMFNAYFEDKEQGGFFTAADKDWNIINREKNLLLTGEVFGVLMHLYEITYNDQHLLKAMDFLDVALDKAWDTANGGFFERYDENWGRLSDTKDLATQASMLQHMNGSWKDGMDSPYGARAAYHKNRAASFADLLFEKAADKVNGGFYTLFAEDWKPASTEKDVCQLATFALTLYFHYHNFGPSVWGPRKGSHAFTGRGYPAVYAYRGPAPNVDPAGEESYLWGKKVIELADILIQHAWDAEHGGFYTSLTEDHQPANEEKSIETQITCFMALNVAYRLSGSERFQQKLAEAVKTVEDKGFDPDNGGVYSTCTRNWEPMVRDKICAPNLSIVGIMSMMAPVVAGMDVIENPIKLWLEPLSQEISGSSPASFTVTLQNQGFENMKIRVGGLSSPNRWMEPGDITLDLAPHEVKSYPLTITLPEGMPKGAYCFELTGMPEGEVGEYVAVGGKVIFS